MTVPPCTRERTRTARHRPPLAGQAHRGRPRGSGPFDRKSDAEKYVTTVEAEALAGVYVNRSDRTTVVEHAPFWATARPAPASHGAPRQVELNPRPLDPQAS